MTITNARILRRKNIKNAFTNGQKWPKRCLYNQNAQKMLFKNHIMTQKHGTIRNIFIDRYVSL